MPAQLLLAEITRDALQDEDGALAIYTHLDATMPSEITAEHLGDMYLRQHAPLKAVRTFDTALKAYPGSAARFGAKIGSALLDTHHYTAALKYFQGAAEKNKNAAIDVHVVQRCRLLFGLQKFSECRTSLASSLTADLLQHLDWLDEDSASRLPTLELIVLSGMLEREEGNIAAATKKLLEATRWIDRALQASFAQTAAIREEETVRLRTLSGIAFEVLGKLQKEAGDPSAALALFEESLRRASWRRSAILRTVGIYLQFGSDPAGTARDAMLSKAEKCLQPLLSRSTAAHIDEEALLCAADLHLLRHEPDRTMSYLVRTMAQRPRATHLWSALRRYLDCMHREGKVATEGKRWLLRCMQDTPEMAVQHSARPTRSQADVAAAAAGGGYAGSAEDAIVLPAALASNEGAQYCVGVFYAYTSQWQRAIELLNGLRASEMYGAKAVLTMAQLYLHGVLKDGLHVFERPLTEREQMHLSTVYDLLRDQRGEHAEWLQHLVILHKSHHNKDSATFLQKVESKLLSNPAQNSSMGNSGSTSGIVLAWHLYIKTLLTMHDKAHKARLPGALRQFAALAWTPEEAHWYSWTWLLIAQYHFEVTLSRCMIWTERPPITVLTMGDSTSNSTRQAPSCAPPCSMTIPLSLRLNGWVRSSSARASGARRWKSTVKPGS